MAENERLSHDHREPHACDREGDITKSATPLRGRGCGRKRKGTPVKVFVTSTEEENNSEHTICKGDRKEATASKRPTPDMPHHKAESSHNNFGPPELNHANGSNTFKASSSSPTIPTASSSQTLNPVTITQASSVNPTSTTPTAPVSATTAPASSSFPPSPNCRIREVHCGSQVRLVVIAIRDICKGEEITVDYSLTEWGENLGFRGSISPAQHESNSDIENTNIKKEDDEPTSTTQRPKKQQQQYQDYVTPSWSLSPSSSPISHSDASDSDAGEEGDLNSRGQGPRRRKKRRDNPSKKKLPNRSQSGQPSPASSNCPHPSPLTSASSSSFSTSTKPVFKAPAPLTPNTAANPDFPRAGVSTDSARQTCDYCGRHFRSLGRHLDKHHAHQPDVCSALVERYTQMPRLPTQNTNGVAVPHDTKTESQAELDLSSCPPNVSNHSPISASPATMPLRGQNAVPVSVLKRSPSLGTVTPPRRGGGRRLSKEVQATRSSLSEVEKVEELVRPKEEAVEVGCAESFTNQLSKEKKTEEVNGLMEGEDESGTEDKEKDTLSSGRHQILPLLSSLSSLVLYLRRLQHSAFLSLSRQLQSSEAWRLLCHSSLALLILYNRRRECEVSKLSITEYRARVTPRCPVPVPAGSPPALTPLEASLSPFERLVLSHLPRVGVQGKRGRIQPLILPPHCEPCLELLLQTRQDVGVDPVNPYIFARPYHSPATPLRGTDLLRSLARSSSTRNPRALTQTRVRRQVAILTQLLLLGEGEEPGLPGGSAVERLEHFLEREYHVTQNCAGIGQDPGLMGRVGRVVLCGERDGVLFRGMSLNHICLELDVMSGNSADSFSEGESEGDQVKEKNEAPTLSPAPKPTPPTLLYVRKGKNNGRVGRPKKLKNTQAITTPLPTAGALLPIDRRRGSGKRGVLKRPWSEAERAAVEEHLTQNINELRVPAKADCERCLQKCPLLVSNQRDWRAIKFYCHNRIQLLKKNQRRESQPQPLIVC
ncbi:uncharacterized protein LOC144198568 [Stigmatopora nigra]